MISDFLLSWSRLNLLSLSSKKQDKIASLGVSLKAVTHFEYEKIEKSYWTGEWLLNQTPKKALTIRKILCPGYSLLFIVDNITS